MANAGNSNHFLMMINGTIDWAVFPLGCGCSQVFCRFELVAGDDWELLSGVAQGISQAAVPKYPDDKIVFNMPVECTYRSANIFGWPKLLISIYGRNRWSVDTVLGYAWIHLPFIKQQLAKTTISIRIPKDTSVFGELANWLTSKNIELKNPRMLLDAHENNEILSMDKVGDLTISVRNLCRASGGFYDVAYGTGRQL